MEEIVRQAQFDEDKRTSLLKFRRADLDVARSSYNLGVGEGLPEAELAARQEETNKVVDDVNRMTLEQQASKTHRLELEQQLGEANAKLAKGKRTWRITTVN